jgi:hypothetical protein
MPGLVATPAALDLPRSIARICMSCQRVACPRPERIAKSMPSNENTVLFLVGSHPRQTVLLEAATLAAEFERRGICVQPAAMTASAVQAWQGLCKRPAILLRPGISWLGGLGRRPYPGALAVYAWDLEAAGSAQAITGAGVPLCVTLSDPLAEVIPSPAHLLAALGSAARIICHRPGTARRLCQAGLAADRVRVLSPAVDVAQAASSGLHQAEIRRRLRLAAHDAPVFAVPRLVGQDEGHFRAGWAAMLLRKGDVPATLLLPEPSREASRVVRFAASCQMQAGIAIAPKGTGWLDLLAASDGLVIPSPHLFDPVAVAWAMAAGQPVVTAGLDDEPPLLDGTTHMPSATVEPLNLARALLKIWQDRAVRDATVSAARQRVQEACNPALLVATYVEICPGCTGPKT